MLPGLVITVGEILVEIMATEPGYGFLAPQPLIGPFPSGAPAIFIDQVGRLGCPCGLIGAVGEDDFGRVNLERLTRDGVDISAVAVLPGVATGSAFVRYRPDGERDFVYNIGGSASGRVATSPEAERLIAEAGHLHVMGSALSVPAAARLVLAAIDAIKSRGGQVSFDPNVRKELLRDPATGAALRAVLARTDLFLPSAGELAMFADGAPERDAVRLLQAGGLREIVLKRGAAGATYFGPDGATNITGFRVEEIDPTGAGDCFGATFVVCRRNGMDVQAALTYAAAAGARAVTVKGPMEGNSTFAELDAFLASRGDPGVTVGG